MIYCSPGTGGLFLTSVLAQTLGLDIHANFSSTGHAHDMGSGNWGGAATLCFIGDHWDLAYRPGFPLYYSHVIPNNFIQKNPNIRLIKLNTDPVDYRKVTELYVKKAWPDIWTAEEYAKWATPNYPPYSRDNILDSELVQSDLINDLEITNIKKWHEANVDIQPYACINFRTIMGIDSVNLANTVSNIVGLPVTDATRHYITEYQQLNQSLYFKDYV